MELQDQLVDETKKRCKEEGYPKFTDEQVKPTQRWAVLLSLTINILYSAK